MATGTIVKDISESGPGYCKMPDGTLIQWGVFTTTFTTGTARYAFTFPISFALIPVVSLNVYTGDTNYCIATGVSIAANLKDATAHMLMPGSIGKDFSGSGTCSWLAVGRWK